MRRLAPSCGSLPSDGFPVRFQEGYVISNCHTTQALPGRPVEQVSLYFQCFSRVMRAPHTVGRTAPHCIKRPPTRWRSFKVRTREPHATECMAIERVGSVTLRATVTVLTRA